MRRHPVEDDADAGPVRAVDEARKALRVAEAGGRRIEPGRLVAPGRIVGMLGDRQELDMGEAHVDDIGDQLVGQLVPGQEPAVVAALPGAGMHLVDRHRLAARDRPCARWRDAPRRSIRWPVGRRRDRGGRRAAVPSAKAKGSAFSGRASPSGADDLVFVGRARRRCRERRFPRCRCRCAGASTWRRPSQSLKSPTTETRCALGAQTAKCTPSAPSWSIRCAPSLSNSRRCEPSRDVVVVHRPEHRAEAE